MPVYVFEAEDGERIEVNGSMKSPPQPPYTRASDGKVFPRRCYGAGVATPAVWSPYLSSRLPRFTEGADGHDAGGRPYIGSQATERNIAARLGMERE